ncbi:MAG: gliding motility-associated C-terminal domain-containing protein [Bacteroidetes bacterium]|nr:gliding motility-associated C-terminal domain-containing protein [Bacteroidota bacterium]
MVLTAARWSLLFVVFIVVSLTRPVSAQPTVIGHPKDSSICVDASASFRVLALNTAAYQWQENDGVGWYNITAEITYAQGYLTPELRIMDANLGLNGYRYRCVVFDAQNNQAVSNSARLGVYDPPIITQQPSETRVCKNSVAHFSIQSVYGTKFQWQESIGTAWANLVDNAFYSGTKTPNLNIFTTTGMNGFSYRCIATNVSCPDTSMSAKLFVDPTPVIYGVTGGGAYCQGGNGVPVGLDASQTGISYHLLREGQSTGIVRTGDGNPIDFGMFTQSGSYSVLAINGFTGCQINMTGTAFVSISPLPNQQQLMGGGAYCLGSDEPELYLAGTQNGINYALYRNGVSLGQSITGNGFTMSFGYFGLSGLYTVLASNPATGCTVQLTSTKQITANPIPIANAGNDQTIVAGNTVTLTGTPPGGSDTFAYRWEPENLCVTPNQRITSSIPLYQTRLFMLRVTNQATGCWSLKDTVMVRVTDGPLVVHLQSSAAAVCPDEQVSLLALTSGGTGNYTYTWSSIPPGLSGSGAEITTTPLANTSYVVRVQDGIQTVFDTVSVQVNQLPLQQLVSGGTAICAGSQGAVLNLASSEIGVVYMLYRDNVFVRQLNGTGNQLNLGTYNIPGTYRVTAKYVANSCVIEMNGQAVISINENPLAITGPNQYITAGSQTTLSGAGSGGSGNYTYQWTPPEYLLNPAFQNPSALALNATRLFNLVVTDQQTGCQSTANQTVVFVSGGGLSLNLAASQYSICPGEQVQLIAMPSGGSGNYTYLWQSSPPGFVSSLFNPVVNPSQTATYKITVTDGFLVATDSLQVVVRSAPATYNVTGGGVYCAGGQGKEVFVQLSEQNTVYQLFRNGNSAELQLNGTGNSLNFGFQTEAGAYTVKALNPVSNCLSVMSGSATVQVNQLAVVNAGPDRTITTGQTTSLTGQVIGGSGVYNYAWQPVQSVINPTAPNTTTQPLFASTIFSLGVTDAQYGCPAQRDTVVVYVSGGTMTVDAFSDVQAGCIGEPVQLYGLASGGTGNFQYQWTTIPAGFYTNVQNPIVHPQMPTRYVLTVTDGISTMRDTLLIQVSAPPQQFNVTGGGKLCHSGQSTVVGLSGSETGVLYYLMLNGMEINMVSGQGETLSFGLFNQPGTYTVYAQTRISECTSQMIGSAVISIDAGPLANAGPDKQVPAGGQVTLEGSVTGGSGQYQFQWTPAAKLLNPDALQPTTKPLFYTRVFKLEVTDLISGCSGSNDYAAVFVQGGNLEVEVVAAGNGGCPGTPVQLFALPTGGSGNYSYIWLSNPPGFTSTVFNPTAYPEVSTTYIALINDGNIIIRDSVSVYVESGPAKFLQSGGGAYCKGEEGIEISLSGSQAGVAYHLMRDGVYSGISEAGNGFPISFGPITQAGHYVTMAENTATGCRTTMDGEAVIEVSEPVTALAGLNQTINQGGTATLIGDGTGGSGDFHFAWTPSYLVVNPDQASTPTLPLNNSALFLLRVTDVVSGCPSATDSTIVFVGGGNLKLTVMANDNSICAGNPVSLLALPSGGTGNYQVLWTNQEGDLLFEGESWEDSPEATTTYYVSLSDQVYELHDSITVFVSNIPQAFQVTGGGAFCPSSASGLPIGLSGSEEGIQYDLYLNQALKLTTVVGQGAPISFGYFSQQGSYSVKARVPGFLCEQVMNGAATIQQFVAPQIDAGPDLTIEKGQQADLLATVVGGSGSFSYNWMPIEMVVSPGLAQTSTIPLAFSVQFTVEVTDAETNCNARDYVVVYTQGGTLEADIQLDHASVCPGDAATLTALPGGGTGNYSWLWSSRPAGFSSNNATIKVFPTTSTWYIVQVSDGEQSVKDSVLVQTNALPMGFSLEGGGSFCDGSMAPSIDLTDTEPGIAYSLMRNGTFTGQTLTGNGSGMSYGSQQATGNYTVVATSLAGCQRIMPDVKVISRIAAPLTYSLLGGGEFCGNDSAGGLYLTGSEKQTTYSLLRSGLSTNLSFAGTGGPVSIPNPAISGIYTLEATKNLAGCSKLMAGAPQLMFYPVPEAAITGESFICAGSETTLSGSGGDTYYWFTDPPAFTREITVTPYETSVYRLRVANSFGCNSEAEFGVEVGQLPQPELINQQATHTIIVSQTDYVDYTFMKGNTVLQSGPMNSFYYGNTILDGDSLIIRVTAASGCQAGKVIWIEEDKAVNAFSPNNDGINDRFMTGRFIRIYSRWGKELYAGDEGWDGRFEGVMMAPGTYYFVREVEDDNGTIVRTVKGSVTLVIE